MIIMLNRVKLSSYLMPELSSTTQATFLRSFEDYITQVVASNHNKSANEAIRIVVDGFNRSIQANFEYHDEISRIDKQKGDKAAEAFHWVMSEIYRSILEKK